MNGKHVKKVSGGKMRVCRKLTPLVVDWISTDEPLEALVEFVNYHGMGGYSITVKRVELDDEAVSTIALSTPDGHVLPIWGRNIMFATVDGRIEIWKRTIFEHFYEIKESDNGSTAP